MNQQKQVAVAGGVALAGLAAWAVKLRREASWERTLERVSCGVVVVRVSSVMAFDMNDAGFSLATGFVVDAAPLLDTDEEASQKAMNRVMPDIRRKAYVGWRGHTNARCQVLGWSKQELVDRAAARPAAGPRCRR